jgi:hypothetical protein
MMPASQSLRSLPGTGRVRMRDLFFARLAGVGGRLVVRPVFGGRLVASLVLPGSGVERCQQFAELTAGRRQRQ